MLLLAYLRLVAEKEKKKGNRTQQATHLFDWASIGQDGSQRIEKPSKAPAANQLARDKGREIRKGGTYECTYTY